MPSQDTGAYTMSMYCKFNSILASPVYGCWRDPASGEVKLVCYKERETVEEGKEMVEEER